MNKKFNLRILAMILAVIITGIISSDAVYALKDNSSDSTPNILFISSYSLSFPSVPLQIDGIQSVLTDADYDLDMEFMDAKRFSDEEDISLFYQVLHHKLSKLPPYDAIILGDDMALSFAMEYEDELFPDIPMVFLGVNSLSLAQEAHQNAMITGLAETTSHQANLELARKIQSNATSIIAIVDNTLTGKGDQEQFLKATHGITDMQVRMLNSSSYSRAELRKKLQDISSDDIVFFLTMFEDGDGNYYSIPDGACFLAENMKAPVFRMSIGGVGEGLLGGLLFDYEGTGRDAALMVQQILGGKSPSQIAVVYENTPQGLFDYNVMEQYHISETLLPENSTILNKPANVVHISTAALFPILFVIFIGILFIIYLMWSDYNRKKMLNHDSLTRIYSRSWMNRYLAQLIGKKLPFCLFMLDFDNFKYINDTYGHLGGDEILRQVAARISKINDSHIIVARYGGDEFIGVIHATDDAEIAMYANQILESFHEPFALKDVEIYIQISMGIARYPQEGIDAEELLTKADTAMYHVKNKDKNGYCMYSSIHEEKPGQ